MANADAAGVTWKPSLYAAGANACVPFDQLKYEGHGEKKAGEDAEGDA